MTLEMDLPTVALNELTLVAPIKVKKKMESSTSLLEQEQVPFQQQHEAAPVKADATAAESQASKYVNANFDKENTRAMPLMDFVKACDLEQELKEVAAAGIVVVHEEATPVGDSVCASASAMKPLAPRRAPLPESATLGETFTLSDETSASDALMYRLSMESGSSSLVQEVDNERQCSEERECSDERRGDYSDDRALPKNVEYIPFDEMRDDAQDAISSVDPALLETRVHVNYSEYNVNAPEPPSERDNTIMFLATSTESWDCHVARETSLFDDDNAVSSVDSSCLQDEGEIEYDTTRDDEDDAYTYDESGSSAASSSMLGSGGTEYTKAGLECDPIGIIQSIFLEWAGCVAGVAKN